MQAGQAVIFTGVATLFSSTIVSCSFILCDFCLTVQLPSVELYLCRLCKSFWRGHLVPTSSLTSKVYCIYVKSILYLY